MSVCGNLDFASKRLLAERTPTEEQTQQPATEQEKRAGLLVAERMRPRRLLKISVDVLRSGRGDRDALFIEIGYKRRATPMYWLTVAAV